MKTVLEEGFIGVDMPPLPDDIWRGVRLLQLTEIASPAYTTNTTSSTFTTWLSPVTEAVTTSGTASLYGIICSGDPVNSADPSGLTDSLIGVDVNGSLVLGAGPVGGFQGIVGPTGEGVTGIYGYHNLLTLEDEDANETYGLDAGIAGQLIFGLGNGSYEGKTRSIALSFSWLTGSVFWSPGGIKNLFTGDAGWVGITIGGNLGVPVGAAWERVSAHKLFPRPKKCDNAQ